MSPYIPSPEERREKAQQALYDEARVKAKAEQGRMREWAMILRLNGFHTEARLIETEAAKLPFRLHVWWAGP